VPSPEVLHAQLTGDLSLVVHSLHETYDDRLGVTVVDAEIQQVADLGSDWRYKNCPPGL
jgi:hypothetical protein